jgi:serine/threonine protein kinase
VVPDFGIARAISATGGDALTRTGVTTPTYMSPEQVAGEKDLDGRWILFDRLKPEGGDIWLLEAR